MRFWDRLIWGMRARRDARFGSASPDALVTAELGARPTWNPATDHRHAQAAHGLNRNVDIAEFSDDLRRIEMELARHTPSWLLLVGLVFTAIVEMLGGILVVRSFGFAGPERLVLGAALALALIAITAGASHHAGARVSGGAEGARPGRLGRFVVMGSYGLLVLSIAVIRASDGSDESTTLEAIASSVVMLAVTIGPAWVADWLLLRRAPVRLLERQARLIRQRLRTAEKTLRNAQVVRTRHAAELAAWDREAARMQALFTLEGRRVAHTAEDSVESTALTRRNP